MTDSTDCKKINVLLDPYLDSELPGDSDIALVENHLAGCASCRDQLARLKSASDAIKSLPTLTMESDLSDDLSFLEKGRDNLVAFRGESRSKQIYAWAGALAAALVLSLLSYAALNQTSQPEPAVAVKTPEQQPAVSAKVQPDRQEPAPPAVASVQEHQPDGVEVASTNPALAPSKKDNGPEETPAPAVADNHSDRSGMKTPPAVAVKAVTCPGELLSTEAVIAYDGEEDSGFADLGISTNEDGLYAIKL
ncbi:MAG: zf-HC2 domain-containing protein [Cyanobacteria bacterium HKST-UBA02]|nr:zf-HC2 domain-containing protein [Cyanobacteria bacterium HKST-UBA02]